VLLKFCAWMPNSCLFLLELFVAEETKPTAPCVCTADVDLPLDLPPARPASKLSFEGGPLLLRATRFRLSRAARLAFSMPEDESWASCMPAPLSSCFMRLLRAVSSIFLDLLIFMSFPLMVAVYCVGNWLLDGGPWMPEELSWLAGTV